MNRNYRALTRRVANRTLLAYQATGDLEKVTGHILTRSLGVTDAPKELFEQVTTKVTETLKKEDLDLDLKDPVVYPHVQRIVREVADDLGLL